jgi:membrane protein implicated in regulation of membrane protease activity
MSKQGVASMLALALLLLAASMLAVALLLGAFGGGAIPTGQIYTYPITAGIHASRIIQ